MISRAVVLVFGMLYPAYYSYKAVKTKNVKEYVRWMMYWIVFALYTVIETVTDQTVAWFPLYYELKIAFVVWLLSPYTKGASLIYRKFLHPLLSSKERVRYISYFYKSFVRNVHHCMVCAIKRVKLSFHGGGLSFLAS